MTITPARGAAWRVVGAAALVLLTTCARNPVTGQREFSLVSESKEISMGKQGASEVASSIGLVADPALQAYVSSLGMPMAARSERPTLPWSFSVVEDEAVNAFALPGGPVFVTRGILAHMNSEAQLVSVLGHEMGHITARHSASQISKSQIMQVGLVATVLVKPAFADYADIASQGLGLFFLKFSRDDETQADGLGFRYMVEAGYDPREMGEMFRTLGRMTASGGGRVPEWLSTHPDPGNRVQKTQQRIAATPTLPANLKVDRDGFIQRLDGLMFGANPRQGFFRGTSFFHPDLRFQLDFPGGWKTQNQPTQVAGVSGAGDAMVALTFAGPDTPTQALQKFLTKEGMQNRGTSTSAINGFPAASAEFTVTAQDGSLAGRVAFINLDGSTVRVIGYTTAAKLATYDDALRAAVMSLRRLTDPTALSVRPSRVRLVRINRAMTVAEFNRANPSSISLGQVALINGVDSTATIPAGTLVKRVVVDR
jgi:predicted Zn-dependent protease